MREVFEFRIEETLAAESLPQGIGKTVGGWIRVIEVDRSDPLFQKIGQLQFKMKALKKTFYLSWNVRRSYTKEELSRGEFFSVFEDRLLLNDDIADDYDEGKGCRLCGAGAPLRSPLLLKHPIKRKFDMARTIGGELVVSARVMALFMDNRITGCEWSPVHVANSNGKGSDFFQLQAGGGRFEVVEPTRFGINPFDPDVEGEFLCKLGHKYGLNLLSEVHFSVSSEKSFDLMHSSGFIGDRRGLLRPTRLMIVSARVVRLLRDAKIGMRVEVAHQASSL